MNRINFESQVIERSKTIPVMVEIASPSCGPCVWMEKTLIDVTRSMSGKVEFVSVSIMDYPELAEDYKIASNPTTLLFINGRVVARLKGALPAMVVEQWLGDHIGSQV